MATIGRTPVPLNSTARDKMQACAASKNYRRPQEDSNSYLGCGGCLQVVERCLCASELGRCRDFTLTLYSTVYTVLSPPTYPADGKTLPVTPGWQPSMLVLPQQLVVSWQP